MKALSGADRSVWRAVAALTMIMLLAGTAASAQEQPQDLVVTGAGVGLRGVRYLPPTESLPEALTAVAALVVENPNRGFAAEGVRFQLTVFGADDGEIGDVTVDVPQILPDERRGIVSDTRIRQDGLPVVRVEAEVVSVARWVPVRPVPLLEFRLVMAFPSFHGDLVGGGAVALPFASGTLTNPLDAALGEVILTGIVFDQDGRVAGGSLRRLPYLVPYGTYSGSAGTLIYGTDIESRSLTGASWGWVKLFAAYPWIDLGPYRR